MKKSSNSAVVRAGRSSNSGSPGSISKDTGKRAKSTKGVNVIKWTPASKDNDVSSYGIDPELRRRRLEVLVALLEFNAKHGVIKKQTLTSKECLEWAKQCRNLL